MIRQGQLLGEAFDHVILYEDHYLRGRADGEIIGLFRAGHGLRHRVQARSRKSAARSRPSRRRLRSAQPGDLLVVQADAIDETVHFIRRYVESITPEPMLAAEGPALKTAAAPEVLEGAEIDANLLAKAPAIAKVVPIAPCP